ncbi:MAG: type VI secretion system tube protein Hcp [Planctomycetales bacterium]|nr:type VI secretion system tube protein Hcp [bacterium]UNM07337.1 MAG: type VI secretion system tube protein Hcp [Planctomycetales bacterium]
MLFAFLGQSAIAAGYLKYEGIDGESQGAQAPGSGFTLVFGTEDLGEVQELSFEPDILEVRSFEQGRDNLRVEVVLSPDAAAGDTELTCMCTHLLADGGEDETTTTFVLSIRGNPELTGLRDSSIRVDSPDEPLRIVIDGKGLAEFVNEANIMARVTGNGIDNDCDVVDEDCDDDSLSFSVNPPSNGWTGATALQIAVNHPNIVQFIGTVKLDSSQLGKPGEYEFELTDVEGSLKVLPNGKPAPDQGEIVLIGELRGMFAGGAASGLAQVRVVDAFGNNVPVASGDLDIADQESATVRVVVRGWDPTEKKNVKSADELGDEIELSLQCEYDGKRLSSSIDCPLELVESKKKQLKAVVNPLKDGVNGEVGEDGFEWDNDTVEFDVLIGREFAVEGAEVSVEAMVSPELKDSMFSGMELDVEAGDVELDKRQLLSPIRCTFPPVDAGDGRNSGFRTIPIIVVVGIGDAEARIPLEVPFTLGKVELAPVLTRVVPVNDPPSVAIAPGSPDIEDLLSACSFSIEVSGENLDEKLAGDLEVTVDGEVCGVNESSYEILENGAGKFKVDIEGCPVSSSNVESIINDSSNWGSEQVLPFTVEVSLGDSTVSCRHDLKISVGEPEAILIGLLLPAVQKVRAADTTEFGLTIQFSGENLTEQFMGGITVEDLVIDEREMTTGADWDYRLSSGADGFTGHVTVLKIAAGGGGDTTDWWLETCGGERKSEFRVSCVLVDANGDSQDLQCTVPIEWPEEVVPAIISLAVSSSQPVQISEDGILSIDFEMEVEGFSDELYNSIEWYPDCDDDDYRLGDFEVSYRTYQPGQPQYGNITFERNDSGNGGDNGELKIKLRCKMIAADGGSSEAEAECAVLLPAIPPVISGIEFSSATPLSADWTTELTLKLSGENLDVLRRSGDQWLDNGGAVYMSSGMCSGVLQGFEEPMDGSCEVTDLRISDDGSSAEMTMTCRASGPGKRLGKSTPILFEALIDCPGGPFDVECPLELSAEAEEMIDRSTPKLSESVALGKVSDFNGDGLLDIVLTCRVSGQGLGEITADDLDIQLFLGGSEVEVDETEVSPVSATAFDLSVFVFEPQEIKAAASRMSGGRGGGILNLSLSQDPESSIESPFDMDLSEVLAGQEPSVSGFRGGVKVAVGDLTGDGRPDIVVSFELAGENLDKLERDELQFDAAIDGMEIEDLATEIDQQSASSIVGHTTISNPSWSGSPSTGDARGNLQALSSSSGELLAEQEFEFGTSSFQSEIAVTDLINVSDFDMSRMADGSLQGVVVIEWFEEAVVDDLQGIVVLCVLPGGFELQGELSGEEARSKPREIVVVGSKVKDVVRQMSEAGWSGGEVEVVIQVEETRSPRDAASGMASGKRQHKPVSFTKPIDKSTPLLMTCDASDAEILDEECVFSLTLGGENLDLATPVCRLNIDGEDNDCDDVIDELRIDGGTVQVGLLLPAVQAAREAARRNGGSTSGTLNVSMVWPDGTVASTGTCEINFVEVAGGGDSSSSGVDYFYFDDVIVGEVSSNAQGLEVEVLCSNGMCVMGDGSVMPVGDVSTDALAMRFGDAGPTWGFDIVLFGETFSHEVNGCPVNQPYRCVLSFPHDGNDATQISKKIRAAGNFEGDLTQYCVVSPRDAASGLPTGKRQHKPIRVSKPIDKATPLLMGVVNTGDAVEIEGERVEFSVEVSGENLDMASPVCRIYGNGVDNDCDGPIDDLAWGGGSVQIGLLLPAVQKVREAARRNGGAVRLTLEMSMVMEDGSTASSSTAEIDFVEVGGDVDGNSGLDQMSFFFSEPVLQSVEFSPNGLLLTIEFDNQMCVLPGGDEVPVDEVPQDLLDAACPDGTFTFGVDGQVLDSTFTGEEQVPLRQRFVKTFTCPSDSSMESRLRETGFLECFLTQYSIIAPRDAASGLPTGKRQHKPISVTKPIDKATPLLLSIAPSGGGSLTVQGDLLLLSFDVKFEGENCELGTPVCRIQYDGIDDDCDGTVDDMRSSGGTYVVSKLLTQEQVAAIASLMEDDGELPSFSFSMELVSADGVRGKSLNSSVPFEAEAALVRDIRDGTIDGMDGSSGQSASVSLDEFSLDNGNNENWDFRGRIIVNQRLDLDSGELSVHLIDPDGEEHQMEASLLDVSSGETSVLIGLLLPAVQKVREAAARSKSREDVYVWKLRCVVTGADGSSSETVFDDVASVLLADYIDEDSDNDTIDTADEVDYFFYEDVQIDALDPDDDNDGILDMAIVCSNAMCVMGDGSVVPASEVSREQLLARFGGENATWGYDLEIGGQSFNFEVSQNPLADALTNVKVPRSTADGGFLECFLIQYCVVSPRDEASGLPTGRRDSASGRPTGRRDAASGLPTGKRQHKPMVITKELDKSSPLLYNVLVNNENVSQTDDENLRFGASLALSGENLEVGRLRVFLIDPTDGSETEMDTQIDQISSGEATVQIGLLLPAVQKVREAAARSRSKEDVYVWKLRCVVEDQDGGTSVVEQPEVFTIIISSVGSSSGNKVAVGIRFASIEFEDASITDGTLSGNAVLSDPIIIFDDGTEEAFGSQHSGGVNVLMGDGSVHFIVEMELPGGLLMMGEGDFSPGMEKLIVPVAMDKGLRLTDNLFGSEIDILAWSFGEVKAPRDAASGMATGRRDAASGMATGRRTYEPIVIRKRIDKSTPLLFEAARLSNGHVTVLKLADTGNDGMCVVTFDFSIVGKELDKSMPGGRMVLTDPNTGVVYECVLAFSSQTDTEWSGTASVEVDKINFKQEFGQQQGTRNERSSGGGNYFGAWPSEWILPATGGNGNDVAMEELTLVFEAVEIAHEGLKMQGRQGDPNANRYDFAVEKLSWIWPDGSTTAEDDWETPRTVAGSDGGGTVSIDDWAQLKLMVSLVFDGEGWTDEMLEGAVIEFSSDSPGFASCSGKLENLSSEGSGGATGQSRRRGDVKLEDIVVSRDLDMSTTKLMLGGSLTVSGGSLRSSGGTGNLYEEVTVKPIRLELAINAPGGGGSADPPPTEDFSLNFEEIKVTYGETDSMRMDGNGGAIYVSCWASFSGEGNEYPYGRIIYGSGASIQARLDDGTDVPATIEDIRDNGGSSQILIGLLLPAVQKVRDAAARSESLQVEIRWMAPESMGRSSSSWDPLVLDLSGDGTRKQGDPDANRYDFGNDGAIQPGSGISQTSLENIEVHYVVPGEDHSAGDEHEVEFDISMGAVHDQNSGMSFEDFVAQFEDGRFVLRSGVPAVRSADGGSDIESSDYEILTDREKNTVYLNIKMTKVMVTSYQSSGSSAGDSSSVEFRGSLRYVFPSLSAAGTGNLAGEIDIKPIRLEPKAVASSGGVGDSSDDSSMDSLSTMDAMVSGGGDGSGGGGGEPVGMIEERKKCFTNHFDCDLRQSSPSFTSGAIEVELTLADMNGDGLFDEADALLLADMLSRNVQWAASGADGSVVDNPEDWGISNPECVVSDVKVSPPQMAQLTLVLNWTVNTEAMKQQLAARRGANESSAISTLRTVVSANTMYLQDGSNGPYYGIELAMEPLWHDADLSRELMGDGEGGTRAQDYNSSRSNTDGIAGPGGDINDQDGDIEIKLLDARLENWRDNDDDDDGVCDLVVDFEIDNSTGVPLDGAFRFSSSLTLPDGSSVPGVIEYQDGNDLILRKRPGRTKYSNITLKRGFIDDGTLISVVDFQLDYDGNDEQTRGWITEVVQGKGWKRTLTIKEITKDGGAGKFSSIDNASEEKERGITINTSHVEYRSVSPKLVDGAPPVLVFSDLVIDVEENWKSPSTNGEGEVAYQLVFADGSTSPGKVEYQDGDDPILRKRPGRIKFGTASGGGAIASGATGGRSSGSESAIIAVLIGLLQDGSQVSTELEIPIDAETARWWVNNKMKDSARDSSVSGGNSGDGSDQGWGGGPRMVIWPPVDPTRTPAPAGPVPIPYPSIAGGNGGGEGVSFTIEITGAGEGTDVDSAWETCSGGSLSIEISDSSTGSDQFHTTTPGHKYVDTLTLRGSLTGGRKAMMQWYKDMVGKGSSSGELFVRLTDGTVISCPLELLFMADSNGDGVPDYIDDDSDNDGILDGRTDPNDADSDDDGVSGELIAVVPQSAGLYEFELSVVDNTGLSTVHVLFDPMDSSTAIGGTNGGVWRTDGEGGWRTVSGGGLRIHETESSGRSAIQGSGVYEEMTDSDIASLLAGVSGPLAVLDTGAAADLMFQLGMGSDGSPVVLVSLDGSVPGYTPMFNPKEVSVDKSVPWRGSSSADGDYNSSRSNNINGMADSGSGGGSSSGDGGDGSDDSNPGAEGADYNSSRSNKTHGLAGGDDGGNGGDGGDGGDDSTPGGGGDSEQKRAPIEKGLRDLVKTLSSGEGDGGEDGDSNPGAEGADYNSSRSNKTHTPDFRDPDDDGDGIPTDDSDETARIYNKRKFSEAELAEREAELAANGGSPIVDVDDTGEMACVITLREDESGIVISMENEIWMDLGYPVRTTSDGMTQIDPPSLSLSSAPAAAFQAELGGISFTGLEFTADQSQDVIEYQDGNDLVLRKRPGRVRYGNVTLKRGLMNSPELWSLVSSIVDGSCPEPELFVSGGSFSLQGGGSAPSGDMVLKGKHILQNFLPGETAQMLASDENYPTRWEAADYSPSSNVAGNGSGQGGDGNADDGKATDHNSSRSNKTSSNISPDGGDDDDDNDNVGRMKQGEVEQGEADVDDAIREEDEGFGNDLDNTNVRSGEEGGMTSNPMATGGVLSSRDPGGSQDTGMISDFSWKQLEGPYKGGVNVAVGDVNGVTTFFVPQPEDDELAQAIIIRIRKRPDLLMQEWDSLIDEQMEALQNNPLYEGDNGTGENPLYEGRQAGGDGAAAEGSSNRRATGIVHRDIAARNILLMGADAYFVDSNGSGIDNLLGLPSGSAMETGHKNWIDLLSVGDGSSSSSSTDDVWVDGVIITAEISLEVSGEDFGRYMLRFPVDNSSMGHEGTWFFMPEVDDEVTVAFQEGDPDQPIVIGRLYAEDAPKGSIPLTGGKMSVGCSFVLDGSRSADDGGAVYLCAAIDPDTLELAVLISSDTQMESRRFQTLSNVSRASHDAAMGSIRNMK